MVAQGTLNGLKSDWQWKKPLQHPTFPGWSSTIASSSLKPSLWWWQKGAVKKRSEFGGAEDGARVVFCPWLSGKATAGPRASEGKGNDRRKMHGLNLWGATLRNLQCHHLRRNQLHLRGGGWYSL